ncbi:PRC-barrel domain-containing protein [Rhodomicrobium sp. Az07]|uniref:PRC-barrel domain-containing protein n=1 Tax=Rhodomicrobium sp. Az07 TaxID=2839034 RepID=UPI001BE79C75|nr:PRC-barrel domain-containing protein [Rhodomicrobium sp. Az07]MBT3070383.1 PRC-barrel domain-containing protein [Rhodomicrobium sp. Az07]
MRAISETLRATVAVFIAIGLSPGMADDGTSPGNVPQRQASQPPPEKTVLWSAESVMGKTVVTRTGERAGRVVDVLADGSGAVQAAVVEVGGFLGVGSRRIAIAWADLRFASDKRDTLVVELPRERLSEAPEVKKGEPVVAIGANTGKGRGADGTN